MSLLPYQIEEKAIFFYNIDIFQERNYTYISNIWLIGKEIAYYYIIIGEW